MDDKDDEPVALVIECDDENYALLDRFGRLVEWSDEIKRLGLALLNYESALQSFPPGGCIGSEANLPDPLAQTLGDINVYASGFAMLLPYLEQSALAARYDYRQPWQNQPKGVVDQVIPTLICSSNANDDNPWYVSGMEQFFPIGDSVALTDYIFCKGIYDGWCIVPATIPLDERGMFDLSGPAHMPVVGSSSFVVRPTDNGHQRRKQQYVCDGRRGWRSQLALVQGAKLRAHSKYL
jgi:hypothetical protein